jgi:hypothetical protein
MSVDSRLNTLLSKQFLPPRSDAFHRNILFYSKNLFTQVNTVTASTILQPFRVQSGGAMCLVATVLFTVNASSNYKLKQINSPVHRIKQLATLTCSIIH